MGWLRTQDEYILVVNGSFRGRMYEQTFKEFQNYKVSWLNLVEIVGFKSVFYCKAGYLRECLGTLKQIVSFCSPYYYEKGIFKFAGLNIPSSIQPWRIKKRKEKNLLSDLMIFEGNEVEVFEFEGKVLFNPYHVGNCLGLGDSAVRMAVSKMNNRQVIKVTNSKVKDIDFRKLHNTGENFLTESGVYKLVFKSSKPNAEKFTDWVTDEVLPTIRKTGGYVNNDDLFINTYLPYADESTKLMFKSTLSTVRKQNEVIEKQKSEIAHKENVIIGLVEDITIAEKRQILNRVVRYDHANYQQRWAVLYREFENKYHIDLQHRLSHIMKHISQNARVNWIT